MRIPIPHNFDYQKNNILTFLKKGFKPIYLKWHRLLYFMKYGMPFLDKPIDAHRLVPFLDHVRNIESAAIIGKGASIFEASPLDLINNCDYKVLLNSVDVEYLREYIGETFDAQITTHLSLKNTLVPVLSKLKLQKYKIKLLICNNTLDHDDGLTVKSFWNLLNNRIPQISYLPSPSELLFNPQVQLKKGEVGFTIASSALLLLLNISSIKKIVFVGVDAFHFGYSYRPGIKKNDRHFYHINEASNDPKLTHGLPFLRFLFTALNQINKQRTVVVLFSTILKKHINFPEKPYIQFYD